LGNGDDGLTILTLDDRRAQGDWMAPGEPSTFAPIVDPPAWILQFASRRGHLLRLA
jgi:hypothetical protein